MAVYCGGLGMLWGAGVTVFQQCISVHRGQDYNSLEEELRQIQMAALM